MTFRERGYPLMKKTYDPQIDIDYTQFFEEQASKMGFSYISAKDLPKFYENDFIDFTHLNSKGRNKFSRFIAMYLKKSIL